MATYSIAIRTLGTSGDKFVEELDSIMRQTVKPEKVIIYLAEGYKRPEYSIGIEQYVTVTKGMVAQRALSYDEINSDYILLLDDDVSLAPDSVEKLITALETNNADCVAADTFHNHEMPIAGKIYAALTNLVFPHWSKKWAFKIHSNGSFSYNNNPMPRFYLSQSAAGPVSLWRKSALLAIHFEDELWIDKLGFPYGEDALFFNKVNKNGFKLGVLYDAGVVHQDAKTSSSVFQKDPKRFYVRSFASTVIWYRTCYHLIGYSRWHKLISLLNYAVKVFWLLIVNIVAVLPNRNLKIPVYYCKGVVDAVRFVHSMEYAKIPNFIVK